MKVLVINAGSSSLKYQVIDTDTAQALVAGTVGRIGFDDSDLTHKKGDLKYNFKCHVHDHTEAIQLVLDVLLDSEKGVINSLDEIDAVGHRVLHGGTEFSESVIINYEVKAAIRKCIPLGPLHNPANLMGIEACEKVMPSTPQIAVFDTAFHQTMPAKAYMYGVPKKYHDVLGVRRYGFHGTSHRYVSNRACEFLGIPQTGTKIIVCHLGNGSSLSACVDGKCVDTSMGLTPLEGLLMGTRCGSCDPAVVQFIANNPLDENGELLKDTRLTPDQVLDMMNKKSGLLGISGTSSDMRDVDAAADKGDKNATLAREMLVYGIQKTIGAYVAAMAGVDVIVFTAGIGENNSKLRDRVMANFEYLGVKLDAAKNTACADGKATECVISTNDSKIKVLVIPTNEEMMIAYDVQKLVNA